MLGKLTGPRLKTFLMDMHTQNAGYFFVGHTYILENALSDFPKTIILVLKFIDHEFIDSATNSSPYWGLFMTASTKVK